MRTGDLVIGIDAGTAGMRAGLFTLQGQSVGFYDQSYATLYPRPGWAEQQPAAWWDALVAAVRGCLATTEVERTRIIGLAVDAPCNILLADQEGRPLTNSLIWMDLRGTEQAARLSATHDAVLHYCGGDVPAEWPLPKVLWLKQNEPALWKQATYLIEQMSWLTWRLTGVPAIPQNSAVAISRAAGWGSRLVIMDEPTAALGVRETARVEELILRLRADGLAVLLISHNFDQVMRLSNQVWVMRSGRLVGGRRTDQTSGRELVAMITGASEEQIAREEQPS